MKVEWVPDEMLEVEWKRLIEDAARLEIESFCAPRVTDDLALDAWPGKKLPAGGDTQ